MLVRWSRRDFLEFMGRSAAAAATLGASRPQVLGGSLPFKPLRPNGADTVALADGFTSHVIIGLDEPINERGDLFGTNCDYLAFFPFDASKPDDGLMWVNHEYPIGLFLHGKPQSAKRTREDIVRERRSVGGSIVRVKRDPRTGRWAVVRDEAYNRRLTGETPIPLVAPRPIQGATTVNGTLGNCAGGVTPWKTLLTCEENYDLFYGEVDYASGDPKKRLWADEPRHWEEFFDEHPEHYGWVVEVDVFTGKAKKLTALGRYAHECATTRLARDGRCVAYSGSDERGGCLYKFIADKPGTLETGTLYAGNFARGRWESLDRDEQPALRKAFVDQLEVLIRAREAGLMVGGTGLDRPEDIEIDPATGDLLVTFTNNTKRGNYHGSIVRIRENGADPLALTFEHSTFLLGGKDNGFACPDNMAFDRRGNLWFTTDIAGEDFRHQAYKDFPANALFYVPMNGPDAGTPFQVAAAPVEAELTGPHFSPDGRTLFLSVQHPGECSKDVDHFTSHWPDGGKSRPRSCVIAVQGPALEALTGVR